MQLTLTLDQITNLCLDGDLRGVMFTTHILKKDRIIEHSVFTESFPVQDMMASVHAAEIDVSKIIRKGMDN